MATVNYYSAKGQILGEASPKGPVRRYAPDALGSVVSTFSSATGALENAYRFKPYGTQLVKTGVAADPKFTWVGTLGYRQTGASWSELYVRARHYSPGVSRWTTVDRLWPDESAYVYAGCSPTKARDPSGTSRGGDLQRCINAWVRLGYSPRQACAHCKAAQGYHGGYCCDALPDTGYTVPPWTKPPVITTPIEPFSPITQWPFGDMMGEGSAACRAFCEGSNPNKAKEKACEWFCNKIRSGGCPKLEEYCATLCGSGQKFQCDWCQTFYDSVCLGSEVAG